MFRTLAGINICEAWILQPVCIAHLMLRRRKVVHLYIYCWPSITKNVSRLNVSKDIMSRRKEHLALPSLKIKNEDGKVRLIRA